MHPKSILVWRRQQTTVLHTGTVHTASPPPAPAWGVATYEEKPFFSTRTLRRNVSVSASIDFVGKKIYVQLLLLNANVYKGCGIIFDEVFDDYDDENDLI